MTIEELNKLIKEELDAYLNENEEEEVDAEGGDDIEVTTDEPAEEEGGEALDTLRQIYDMLKPLVEPEAEEEPVEDEEPAEEEGEEEEEEAMDEAVDNHTFFRADNANRVRPEAKDVQGRKEKVNESIDSTARFKKLANIKG